MQYRKCFDFYKNVKVRIFYAKLNVWKWWTNDENLHKLIHDYEKNKIVNTKCQLNSNIGFIAFITVSFYRCYCLPDTGDSIVTYYLHSSSDASTSVFAADVYNNTISRCDNIEAKLFSSKHVKI